MPENRSFLSRVGDVLINGLEVGGALALQREFQPADDRLFTFSPQGTVPVGVTTPRSAASGGDTATLLILAALGFLAFKAAT